MPNLHGTKWGDPTLGTPGGTVTWSLAWSNESLALFGITQSRSKQPSSFLRFDYEQVIEDAFAEWSKYANISFQQVPDGRGGAGFSSDGDIRIFFGDIPGRTLGLGAFPSNTSFGGDILLDARNSYNKNKALFRGLVLHEIGHALGLDHVSTNSVMTPVLKYFGLQRDDRDAIRAIYGDPLIAPAYDIKGGGTFRMKGKNNDLIARGNDKKNTILGTSGQDTIEGGGNHDKLNGSSGNDSISGGDGNDKLIGGGGADTLRGEAGNDKLLGGADADVMDGGDGLDTADYSKSKAAVVLDLLAGVGTAGDALGDTYVDIERVLGTKRRDTILGDDNDNTIIGYGASDILEGRGGNDTLDGHKGNDTLRGDGGDDNLKGGVGDDLLEGGTGNDTLNGSRGADTLEGGAGDDLLRGSFNADVFIFADGHGNDRIRDFNTRSKSEVIDLSAVTALNDFDDVTAAAMNTDGGVLIDTGTGDSILLEGLRLGQLGADDFLF